MQVLIVSLSVNRTRPISNLESDIGKRVVISSTHWINYARLLSIVPKQIIFTIWKWCIRIVACSRGVSTIEKNECNIQAHKEKSNTNYIKDHLAAEQNMFYKCNHFRLHPLGIPETGLQKEISYNMANKYIYQYWT